MEELSRVSDEDIKEALRVYSGLPQLKAEDFLIDALELAPTMLGFPMMMGGPKLPKFAGGKFAKQLDKDVPETLHKFATTKEMAGQLNYFSDMTVLKKNIAPRNKKQAYRPAVRLEDGTVLWHPKARIHADAVTMQPGVKETRSFDYDAIVGSGGIGPDGHYYESSIIGDVTIDMEYRGVKDISEAWD